MYEGDYLEDYYQAYKEWLEQPIEIDFEDLNKEKLLETGGYENG